jgi:hypothetical protein
MRRRVTSEDLQQYRRLLSNETCIDGQKLGHLRLLACRRHFTEVQPNARESRREVTEFRSRPDSVGGGFRNRLGFSSDTGHLLQLP